MKIEIHIEEYKWDNALKRIVPFIKKSNENGITEITFKKVPNVNLEEIDGEAPNQEICFGDPS